MARALKQAGSTPKEGGQYVNVLFVCLFVQGKHEDHATRLPRRVTHDAHSTIQLLLIINHHGTPEESVIRDASEITRSSLQEQQ